MEEGKKSIEELKVPFLTPATVKTYTVLVLVKTYQVKSFLNRESQKTQTLELALLHIGNF